MRILAAALTLLALAGCAETMARDRAVAEYPDCAGDRITSHQVSDTVVVLDVCGRSVVYSCSRNGCIHDRWGNLGAATAAQ